MEQSNIKMHWILIKKKLRMRNKNYLKVESDVAAGEAEIANAKENLVSAQNALKYRKV